MISVVVPALNEEDGIGELYTRITAAAREWPDREMELIIVDNGSTDRTLPIARDLARADQRLKIVSLTRNFGHQAAVSAGLSHSTGDVVIVMDADLQDPPESVGPLSKNCRTALTWYMRFAPSAKRISRSGLFTICITAFCADSPRSKFRLIPVISA